MAALDGAGWLTRSHMAAFDETAAILSSSAAQWRSHAVRLKQAVDVNVDQVITPNGTEWTGQTAVSFFETAYADRLAVLPAITHAYAMAEVAERGGERLLGAREAALAAIAEAEADNFSVAQDLSLTDNYTWEPPPQRTARQTAAVGHRNYIAHHAALLHAENQRIAAQLNTGAAQMEGMAPVPWREPVTEFAQPVHRDSDAAARDPKDTIRAVDNHTWRQEPPPVDPATMTTEQARSAYEDLKRDLARYSDRCLRRPFVLPQEQSAFDACVVDSGALNSRKAALEARLRDLGIELEPARSITHGPPRQQTHRPTRRRHNYRTNESWSRSS